MNNIDKPPYRARASPRGRRNMRNRGDSVIFLLSAAVRPPLPEP